MTREEQAEVERCYARMQAEERAALAEAPRPSGDTQSADHVPT